MISLGGEGLMLRQPRSKYIAGRSSTLLKVKRFLDAEARVIGHQPGEGRHKGRLGALEVVLPNGIEFRVGTGFSDREREVPPPIGSTITFRYQELSEGGVPRFPSYVSVRHDLPTATKIPPAAAPATIKMTMPVRDDATPLATASTNGKRYFEYVEGAASKFWEVWQAECEMTTRWGKIGATGQSKTKTFKDAATAAAAVAMLIEEKTADGYVEKRPFGS